MAVSQIPRRLWIMGVGCLMVGVGLRLALMTPASTEAASADAAHALVTILQDDGVSVRSTSSYGGVGVWIDAFDFSPSYQRDGAPPPVRPDVVDTLAAAGVDTIYLQAARLDDRAPGLVLEEALLAEFLVRAHAVDIDVVAWYLPYFDDLDADLDRLAAMATFEAMGHRFDGIAVDIEYTEAVPNATERSERLIELSTRLRASRPGEALGAIVPPAAQLEVVNPGFWPDFPWQALDASYDVWLPMAYSTVRTEASGYRDPYRYAEESTRRMRANIGRDVVVHLIGGIGDELTVTDFDALARAVTDTGAVGASIYDWNSMPAETRTAIARITPD